MTNGLNEIIRKLEEQGRAIERALSALREVEIPTANAPAPRGRQSKRKGGMTPEGRRRLSEALKARWAARRAGTASASARTAPAKAKRKGGITPEGRKRLSEALRKRWAAKKAAAPQEKRAAHR